MGLNIGDTPDSVQSIYDLNGNYTASNGRIVLFVFAEPSASALDSIYNDAENLLFGLQTIYNNVNNAGFGNNIRIAGIVYRYSGNIDPTDFNDYIDDYRNNHGITFDLVNNGAWSGSPSENYITNFGESVTSPSVYIISKFDLIAYKMHRGQFADNAAMYTAINNAVAALLAGPSVSSVSPVDGTRLNALNNVTVTFSEKIRKSDGAAVDSSCFRISGPGAGTLYANPAPTADATEKIYTLTTGDTTHNPGNGSVVLDISRIVTTEKHITDSVFYTPVPLVGNGGHDYYTVSYTGDIAAPAEVTGFTATPDDGQVTLTWTNPGDADFDHVEIWYGSGGSAGTQFTGTIDNTGTVISGLTNGTEYTLKVLTVDDLGNKSTGVSTTATPAVPDTTPPGEVTGLAATPADGQVTLTWTNPGDTDFDHVEIWYGTGGIAGTQFTGTIDNTGTVISGLTNGTEYTFKVVTVDDLSNKSTGVSTNATPSVPDTQAPAEVTGLTATPGNGQVTLTWTDPGDTDFDHVEIWYGSGGTADTQFTGTIDNTGTVINGLTNGTEYTFKVLTVDTLSNISTGVSTNATPTAPFVDIYLRDYVGDTGDPHTGPMAMSPDVFIITKDTNTPPTPAEVNAHLAVYPASPPPASIDADDVNVKYNFIFVRLHNRGDLDANGVTVKLFWSAPSTLTSPGDWKGINSLFGEIISSIDLPAGATVVSPGILWERDNGTNFGYPDPDTYAGVSIVYLPSGDLQKSIHSCFIAIADYSGDPAPSSSSIINADYGSFYNYIRNNNNVTWRNFDEVDIDPGGASGTGYEPGSGTGSGGGAGTGTGSSGGSQTQKQGRAVLPFNFNGTGHWMRRMQLHIATRFPQGTLVQIDMPSRLSRNMGPAPAVILRWLANLISMPLRALVFIKKKKSPGRTVMTLKRRSNNLMEKAFLWKGDRHDLKIHVKLPANCGKDKYPVCVRQLYKGKEIGRITWVLSVIDGKKIMAPRK